MKQNDANGRNIFLVPNADALADSEFETWLPFADGQKINQLRSMRKQPAHISLVGVLLAKHAIHTKWNIPIDQIQFGIGAHGKPYVMGYEQIHFNISHSDSICICAVDDMPIGVDIQKMKPCRFDLIAKRFFTQEEQECYILEGKNQTAFYRMWTKRESVGKYLGIGFHYKPKDDTLDWKTEHLVYQQKYMICICTKNKIY